MSRQNALNYTCDVKRSFLGVSDGEDTMTYTSIYTGVRCRYYKGSGSPRISVNDNSKYDPYDNESIVLEPVYSDINIGDNVALYDTDGEKVSDFKVGYIKKQAITNGVTHHVALSVQRI